jgi:hypothetical protein
MGLSESELLQSFPALSSTTYKITSPYDGKYNCIAWAAEDDTLWWWPDPFLMYYWPSGVPRSLTLEAFVEAYSTIGYKKCEDGNLERGIEKIAIYMNPLNGQPTHAARQKANGKWTSKLGKDVDIMHGTPEGLSGQNYGTVSQFMKRLKTKR